MLVVVQGSGPRHGSVDDEEDGISPRELMVGHEEVSTESSEEKPNENADELELHADEGISEAATEVMPMLNDVEEDASCAYELEEEDPVHPGVTMMFSSPGILPRCNDTTPILSCCK